MKMPVPPLPGRVRITPRRVFFGIVGVVFAVAFLSNIGRVFEDVGPDEIKVIQSPFAGQLDWYDTPGMKYQGFGTVTEYKKRSIYKFDNDTVHGGTAGVKIRFNDGGHGTISGSIQYEMPSSREQLNLIHAKYRSQNAVHYDLIVRITQNAINATGPLMSSRESYAEKRNELIYYVLDQVQNGIYRTRQKTEYIKDPITQQDKQVVSAEIVMGRDGKPERQERSILAEFGIHAFNFTISDMVYDGTVEAQIKQQQQITMDVQTAIAEAKKAEQRALTVEMQGKANAAESKWKQEVIKAQAVTQAEQEKQVAETQAQREKNVAETQAQARKNVATLDAQTADLRKQEQILLGEGESIRKKLVLDADGALEKKLEALVKINASYAQAIKDYRGDWVPRVVMGQQASQTQANGAQILIDLLTAKTARELSVDVTVPRGAMRAQAER